MAIKPLVAVDIDDVIADTTEAIRLWGNMKSGVEMTKEHYSIPGEYWGYYERVWDQKDLNGVLVYDDAEASLIADEIEVPLLAGASFAIKELQKQYSIVLITSRSPLLEPVTRQWLDKHFTGLDIQLYFAKNPKNTSGPEKTKGQLCKELGAFLLIDDNVDHCQSVLDEGLEAILFGNYGWQSALPKGAVRCNDWPTVVEYLSGRR